MSKTIIFFSLLLLSSLYGILYGFFLKSEISILTFGFLGTISIIFLGVAGINNVINNAKDEILKKLNDK